MKDVLRSIRLKNVRCFRDAEVPLSAGINVIIGGNGSGKTTVLEALASLAPGSEEGLRRMPLRWKAKRGEVVLRGATGRQPWARWSATNEQETRLRLPESVHVLVYGRYRRVYTEMEEDTGRAADPYMLLDQVASRAARDCTSTLNVAGNNLVRDVSEYVAALDRGRTFDRRLELVWNRLNQSIPKLDPALQGLRMEERGNRLAPVIVRQGTPVEFRELSDGYQALLVVIFDLMLRYPYLFPDLENPLDGTAIVGVDEVDLHLHPKWQRTVVSQLAELFPNTQFILTTHSPLVVQGALDSRRPIVRLVEKGGEVVAEPVTARLRRELEGAEVGSLLLEDRLFGLPSRYSVAFSRVEAEVGELEEKVREGEAGEAEYRDLQQKAATLERLVAQEDVRRADGSTVAQMASLQKALIDDLVNELKKVKR